MTENHPNQGLVQDLTTCLENRNRQIRALHEACANAIQIIEQLIPEPSARGVADVVLFQLRAALAIDTGIALVRGEVHTPEENREP